MNKLVIAAITLLLACSTSAAQTIYMSPSGSDTAAGTTSQPVYSLNKAVELVRNCDQKTDTARIMIAAGRYFMNAPGNHGGRSNTYNIRG